MERCNKCKHKTTGLSEHARHTEVETSGACYPGVAVQVEVLWQCEEAKLEGSITMKRLKGPAPVYSAPWSTKVSCGVPKPKGTHVIMLQVVALSMCLTASVSVHAHLNACLCFELCYCVWLVVYPSSA